MRARSRILLNVGKFYKISRLASDLYVIAQTVNALRNVDESKCKLASCDAFPSTARLILQELATSHRQIPIVSILELHL